MIMMIIISYCKLLYLLIGPQIVRSA